MHTVDDLPNFEVSEFGNDGAAFAFDMVRLVGRSDIPRPFLHRHSYYHMLWMTQARGRHILDFDTFELRPNTVFFISPGQVHAWASSVRATGYVVNFSTEFFLQMYPRADEFNEFPFFHIANSEPVLYLSAEQNAQFMPLLNDMEEEFNGAAQWRHDIIRSLLLIVLTRLRRLHQPRSGESILPKSYSISRQFKLLVEQRYREFSSVRDYAAALLVTDRRLNAAVKNTTGRTATQIIHDRLLLEAKRLLTQSELSVSEIAYRLNFDDPAYFSRFFKKRVLLTPVEFKKKFSGPLY